MQKELDAQVERDAQLQVQLQAEEEAKAAHSAKKQDAQGMAQELEATRHAFADIPLDTEQEQMSEESRVEISMDTGDMDYSVVVEQGQLPEALSEVEEQAYSCLVTVEMNQIQWKYEALSYLTSIIKGNQEVQERVDET